MNDILAQILMLACGLGLFLFGMKLMSDGLELVAGNRMKGLLERVTGNPLFGVLIGAGITAAIQSSSATTVMVVGFLNAGMLALEQSIYIIMGANVGTTVTSFLIGLKISQIAPVAVFCGAVLIMFFKRKFLKNLGQVIIGFGLLFVGMGYMTDAMAPLAGNQDVVNLMGVFGQNPMLGVLAGALLTAVIQSSSASVGILQALMASGVIGLGSAVYVLFGQNIGTCATALLASIGTNRAGKRAAVMHLLFNVIGTMIFVAISLLIPQALWSGWIESATGEPKMQIAIVHIVFNVVTTLIMLPMAQLLVRLSKQIVRGSDAEYEEMKLHFLDERILSAPAIAVAQVEKEVGRMAGIARNNLQLAMKVFFDPNDEKMKQIKQNEQVVNFLNHSITNYLIKIQALELLERDSVRVGAMFHVVNDIERIGDHAENILEYEQITEGGGKIFSDDAQDELRDMDSRVLTIVDDSIALFMSKQADAEKMAQIMRQEEEIDQLVVTLRDRHVGRLTRGECTADKGMYFIDMLTDLERVSDHATNIMYAVSTDKPVEALE